MEIPSATLEKFRPRERESGDPRNQRDEALSNFFNRGIQVAGAKRGTYRDATPTEIAVLLAHVPTGDLHGFHASCLRAREYGRLFWHLLKPKKA